jgi:hypothetical protein
VFWLSRDLRAFFLMRGASALPSDATAPIFDVIMSPYDYVQALLGFLNTSTTFTAPGVTDPLEALPQQVGAASASRR